MLRIAITPGEPAGIGPDLTLALLAQHWPLEIVVIACPELLQQRAKTLGMNIHIKTYSATALPQTHQANHITVLPIKLAQQVEPGHATSANADYVLQSLREASKRCLSKEFAALVTGPVNKAFICEAGIPFTGHTQYLAELSDVERTVMLLMSNNLRVALYSTHIPLKDVATSLNSYELKQRLLLVHHELQTKFAIKQPNILVCGLNPHAGEQGHLGREEIDIMQPVITELQQQGIKVKGPVPADTAFTKQSLRNIDLVFTLYHDQGLPVLKALSFGEAVNVTLGLPFIRTSVDHGTAFELAGTGQADASSLFFAFNTAILMAQQDHEQASCA